VSTFWVITIAVPLGVMLTRSWARRIAPAFLAVANVGQAVPSIGILVLLAVTVGIGFQPAVYALVLYAVLPVLRNTMVGLDQVDPALIEAGRGMGLTSWGVLRRIELPLAVPVMLAGIRTALIINVGSATLATFVGAGGLGWLINQGNVHNRTAVLLTGSALTAVVALALDWVAGIVEDVLRPKGL
jgi:osmoprotectant transport system permease protein